ncbi:PREDICTED: protein max isoform X4 [Galeopterus variegatus]|uniref:Protein max n=1 Tax=Galeopterus variegatus TaxID=482537 RepID=A0ABM0RKM2_GALVR|nr:PREDICTED: protein max isoform X4 [Galeopterus variegatus]
MSDNDDIEVESDADKRAHHNALERKRRDHIKDSFHSLRDSVPSLQGEKLNFLFGELCAPVLHGQSLMGKCHTFISSYQGHEKKRMQGLKNDSY